MTTPAVIPVDFSSTMCDVFETIKDGVLWAGHMIKLGFEKLIEVIKDCWDVALPYLKEFGKQAWHFIRTGPGIAVGALILAKVLVYSANNDQPNSWCSTAKKVVAVGCVLGAGFVLGMAYAVGFSVPLI